MKPKPTWRIGAAVSLWVGFALIVGFLLPCQAQRVPEREPGIYESHTNATGVLGVRIVSFSSNEAGELVENARVGSIRSYELHLVPAGADTNQVITLAGSDGKVLNDLHELIGERVKVEGRLVELYLPNEQGG